MDWSGAWSDIAGVISSTWPEVHYWSRAENAQELDWEELVRQHARSYPWAIVSSGGFDLWEDGPATVNQYEGEITAVYVAQEDGTEKSGVLEERLQALRAALLSGTFNSIQVFPEARLTVGPSALGEATLLEQKLPATAGALTFRILTQ